MSYHKFRPGHWNKAERDAFEQRWLLQRMAHTWSTDDAPCRCTGCGAKYGPGNAVRRCKARKKPNRWRMHLRRAMNHARYPAAPPIVRNAEWIKTQLANIEHEVKWTKGTDHPSFWKYHRLARRYRRLMRDWWQLPSAEVQKLIFRESFDRDAYAGTFTRKRNQLLATVAKTQRRTIQDEGCTYTFNPDAQWKGLPLFTEGTV
jgi:hypothetical protein